jgi:DNA adenine methylase
MKYLGGKNILGKEIAEVMCSMPRKNINVYLEPFCGALGVLKRMTSEFKKCEASDTHCELIHLWKEVKKDTFNPPKTMTEEKYKKIKAMIPKSALESSLKAFVGFGCAFGGKYFGVYAQKYTNGKKEDYLQAAKNSINKLRPVIQNVKFKCISYDKLKPTNKLIYCDPPYVFKKFSIKYRTKTKKYDDFDSNKFWETMREWSKPKYNNIVIISELHAPKDFKYIWKKKKYRSIAQSKKTRYKNKDTKKYKIERLFIHKSQYNKCHKYIKKNKSIMRKIGKTKKKKTK